MHLSAMVGIQFQLRFDAPILNSNLDQLSHHRIASNQITRANLTQSRSMSAQKSINIFGSSLSLELNCSRSVESIPRPGKPRNGRRPGMRLYHATNCLHNIDWQNELQFSSQFTSDRQANVYPLYN